MKKISIIIVGIIVILAFPILLNYLILQPAHFPVVGEPVNWLMFWPTYIGAFASIGMILFTYKTLKHNKEQLNEIKRQWEEEHKPEIVAYLVGHNNYFYLCVKNISKSSAKNIYITHEPIETGIGFRNEFVDKINKMNFSLEPLGRRYINLNIVYLQHNKEYRDYIGLKFTYDTNNEYSVDLPFSDGSIIEDSLDEHKIHSAVEKIPTELNKIANNIHKK